MMTIDWGTVAQGSLEQGLFYAIMALGVYITFRILDFPDLTVDGSFTTGASIAAVMITHGVSPLLATLAAFAGERLRVLLPDCCIQKAKLMPFFRGFL